jgi:hypothetical protein
MILTLSVHPSRFPEADLGPHAARSAIPANTYHDGFGNFCHVIRAPAGPLTMSTDFLMQDKGEPDAMAQWRTPAPNWPGFSLQAPSSHGRDGYSRR